MATDHIRYDVLARDALRGVLRIQEWLWRGCRSTYPRRLPER